MTLILLGVFYASITSFIHLAIPKRMEFFWEKETFATLKCMNIPGESLFIIRREHAHPQLKCSDLSNLQLKCFYLHASTKKFKHLCTINRIYCACIFFALSQFGLLCCLVDQWVWRSVRINKVLLWCVFPTSSIKMTSDRRLQIIRGKTLPFCLSGSDANWELKGEKIKFMIWNNDLQQ